MQPAASGSAGAPFDRLPERTRSRLLDVSRTIRVPSGNAIFRSTGPHVGTLLEGTARTYLAAPGGRQLTIRYVRPGAIVGSWMGASNAQPVVTTEAVTP